MFLVPPKLKYVHVLRNSCSVVCKFSFSDKPKCNNKHIGSPDYGTKAIIYNQFFPHMLKQRHVTGVCRYQSFNA